MTHAGIDGYSRMIVFMVCYDNNRATTMYEAFLEGVQSFSLPSRVCCDQGGETNREVVERYASLCHSTFL